MNTKTTEAVPLIVIAVIAAIVIPTVIQYYTYIQYTLVGLGVLGVGCVVMGASYMAAMWHLNYKEKSAQVRLLEANVTYRETEAETLRREIVPVKPGHHALVAQFYPNAPMEIKHFMAPPLPLPEKAASVNLIAPPAQEENLMSSIVRHPTWIEEVLFDEYGQLRVFHVKTDGPTGVGKTYLMLRMIELLQRPYPSAEYWLCDPKFEGESSGWPFEPFVTDFDQVAEGAEYLYQNVVTARKHAKREGIKPSHPAFLIFDEADGCFDEAGDKFTTPLGRAIREGRSGWVHCFVAGQSPLAKDLGLSGPLLRNMARFVMGNEAIPFIRNQQFSFHEKSYREKLASQLSYLQERKERGVLVIPSTNQGMPFVGVVPQMEMPNFKQVAQVDKAADEVVKIKRSIFTEAVLSPEPAKESDYTDEQACEEYINGADITSIVAKRHSSGGGNQTYLTLNMLKTNGIELTENDEASYAKYKAKKKKKG